MTQQHENHKKRRECDAGTPVDPHGHKCISEVDPVDLVCGRICMLTDRTLMTC